MSAPDIHSALKALVEYWDWGGYDAMRETRLKEICRGALAEDNQFRDATKMAGNAAKWREALEEIIDALNEARTERRIEHWEYSNLFDIADAALAAPPRNCDVGDANEQADRFKEYCQRYTCCSPCPVHAMWDFTKSRMPSCTLYWAQMPYEAPAEKGGGK